MSWTFVCLQNSCAEAVSPNAMTLGDGAFGGQLGHRVESSWWDEEILNSLHHVRTQQGVGCLQVRKRALTSTLPRCHPDLGLLSPPELWEIHVCCLSHPVCESCCSSLSWLRQVSSSKIRICKDTESWQCSQDQEEDCWKPWHHLGLCPLPQSHLMTILHRVVLFLPPESHFTSIHLHPSSVIFVWMLISSYLGWNGLFLAGLSASHVLSNPPWIPPSSCFPLLEERLAALVARLLQFSVVWLAGWPVSFRSTSPWLRSGSQLPAQAHTPFAWAPAFPSLPLEFPFPKFLSIQLLFTFGSTAQHLPSPSDLPKQFHVRKIFSSPQIFILFIFPIGGCLMFVGWFCFLTKS